MIVKHSSLGRSVVVALSNQWHKPHRVKDVSMSPQGRTLKLWLFCVGPIRFLLSSWAER